MSGSDLTTSGEFKPAVQLPRFLVLTDDPPCTATADISMSNFIMLCPLNGVLPDANVKLP